MIYFVTSNKNKFAEARAIIPELEQRNLDLHEVQELDIKKIIEDKLSRVTVFPAVVEDVALEITMLNGLPGPLVKWFIKALGSQGIVNLAPNATARAVAVVGYKTADEQTRFFEGTIEGTIVHPRGSSGFGFDSIFQPKGETKTFAEMTREEKARYSHRGKAFRKLKEFLNMID